MIEKFPPIAPMLDEFQIAVDVGVEMAELPEQGALGLCIARIELPHLGVEQIIEEQRTVLGALGGRDLGVEPAPQLGVLTGHKGPTDGFGIFEDARLDCFVFSGSGHRD